MIQRSYIPLREAFDLIGNRMFPDEWNSKIAEDKEHQLHVDAKAYLTEAIASDEVEATFQASNFQRDPCTTKVKSMWTTGQFFDLDIVKDYCWIDHIGEPLDLLFFRRQLESFIANQNASRGSNTAGKFRRCVDRLVDLIEGRCDPYPNEKMIADMQAEFPGISKDKVMEAKKIAVNQTGRVDLTKGGRRSGT